MKALTVKQPWASLIMNGIKDVENRTWSTTYRGPLLIHAGAKIDDARQPAAFSRMMRKEHVEMPRSALLGIVDVVDVVDDWRISEWAQPGSLHWVLAHPARFQAPIPCPGKLGLWTPSDEILSTVLDRV